MIQLRTLDSLNDIDDLLLSILRCRSDPAFRKFGMYPGRIISVNIWTLSFLIGERSGQFDSDAVYILL
jgi:hypothetical protein